MTTSQPAATTDLAREVANLVRARLLTPAGANQLNRAAQNQLARAAAEENLLVEVLDGLVVLVQGKLVPASLSADPDSGITYVYWKAVVPKLRDLGVFKSASPKVAKRVLRAAKASLPEAGVVAHDERFNFLGVGRCRCIVLDLAKVCAFLQQKRPVPRR
ncbi:MAG: hypothetical protein Q8L48_25390 [Archangium sp.]|nr:hypothetical protein [Archangium sp.]